AVASIYYKAVFSYMEYFWYLQEFSADQIAWRTWNGGMWGWDEGLKFVLSSQTWNSESTIVRQAWETAWTTIGLCNNVIYDLGRISPENLGMTQEKVDAYMAEVRTLRAWSYYNVFELWGGALPLNVTATSESTEIPGSADPDFDKGCKVIWNFIMDELDSCWETLPVNAVNRMNQAANRIIKARLLLNAEVFIGENRYSECAALCEELMDGKYGSYSIAKDWRDIYSIHNTECPEVVMAFSYDAANLNPGWMRDMPFVAYNIWEYMGGTYTQSGWNCCCIAPSYDNSGEILPNGGTTGATCFLDAPYNDKLGAVYERFNDKDARKKPFHAKADGTYEGIFLLGEQKTWDGSKTLAADADRQDMPLVYVDQVGTFLNLGKNLETVMSPRWGETNSGYRLIKYPIFPESAGIDFQDIDEVEIRFAEVYYMLAECKLRAGDVNGAKELVKAVKGRYFASADDALELPRGFSAYDEDWMLHEWGIEFLCEGRRRRTDLRRFDKFTQGVWWFFGDRAKDDTYSYPAKRDRKYEWYPLPESALQVNPGLVQNPDYL
ncbi:MAG: RagB/SusD family nutrient uptake outer membrane protein, partial [Candidatus Cryptobacteroides sp.]